MHCEAMFCGADDLGNRSSLETTFSAGKAPRYRWHLGCILLEMPAISLRTGNQDDDCKGSGMQNVFGFMNALIALGGWRSDSELGPP